MKNKTEVPARCVAVNLDAEEVAILRDGLAYAFQHWNEKQRGIQDLRLEGWRAESAMCEAKKDATKSASDKLASLQQYQLPIGWKRGAFAPLAYGLASALLCGCGSLTPAQRREGKAFLGLIVESAVRGSVAGAIETGGER